MNLPYRKGLLYRKCGQSSTMQGQVLVYKHLSEILMTHQRKIKSVVVCSAKTDFTVIAQDTCKLLWSKKLLEELKVSFDNPVILSINITHNQL